MEFQCGARNASGVRFLSCEHGGNCVLNAANAQVCVCPPGYKPDYIGFAHFDNCAVPESFLMIFFLVYSVVAIPCISAEVWLVWRARKSPKAVSKLVIGSLVWHILNWIHVLSVYVQDGFYEAALVSLAMYLTLGYLIGSQLVSTFLEPILVLTRFRPRIERLQRLIVILFSSTAILISSTLFAAIPFARDADPKVFNTLMFLMILLSVIGIALTQGTIIASARRLDSMLNSSSNFDSYTSKATERQQRMRKQIKAIVNVSMTFSLGDVLATCFLGVWGSFGSFPYLYVFWTTQFLTAFLTFSITFPALLKLSKTELKADEVVVTGAESIERRGYETIVIQNKKTTIGKLKSRLGRKKAKERFKLTIDLSKIPEEQVGSDSKNLETDLE